jgi:copper(I)-binding protein
MLVKNLKYAAAAAFAVIGVGASTAALAAETDVGAPTAALVATEPLSVQASGCWVRTMPSQLPSSAYFTLKNDGEKPVALKKVDTPAFGKVMMHQTRSNGSTSKMVHVSSVNVPAHGTLQFVPGGYHVLLEQPKGTLKVGSTIPLTLDFGDAGKLVVQCELKPASAVH